MNNITVAICVYNCEKYIEETLKCIIDQTFQEFDLLIVNDCSTDSTLDIILRFFKKHSHKFKLVNFNENLGIACGRKYVMENVNTKYILFIDSDDKPLQNLIEEMFYKIESDKDLIAVGCYHEYIDKAGKKIGGGLFLGPKTKSEFMAKAKNNKLIFMQMTAIFNKDYALKIGGINVAGYFDGKPRYQDFCEDLELWTRMSDFYREGKAIIVIPKVLCQYRKMNHTISTNNLGMILKMRYIKSNLLRRRNNQIEETFISFYNSITPKQMIAYNKEACAAKHLREAVFNFRSGKYLLSIHQVLYTFLINPKYLLQKIKFNL